MTASDVPPPSRGIRPTLDELRAVTQPASTMNRRNAEHWMARWFLRAVSLRVTSWLIRTPVRANHLTGLMILVGLAAAVPLGLAGPLSAVVGAVAIWVYFLLDLCDGEVARWRRQTSVKGVYLDRVGHYVVEAAVLVGYGFRAGGQELGGWTTLGVAAGLLVVIVKAETDLVDVARARSGLAGASESSVELRSAGLARMRRTAQVLRVHQVTGALESSLLLLVAATADALTGSLIGSRVLLVALAAIAATMSVLHLASILLSRRLAG